MMKLYCFGSSSRGNCYLLDNGKDALMIECGIQFTEVERHLGTGVARIAGCLVTHEHGDHAKHLKNVLSARIPVYMTEGTRDALGRDTDGVKGLHDVSMLQPVNVGNFSVLPFPTMHDAKEPCGFLISHTDMGALVFATDTYMLKHRFRFLNHLLIECNYDIALLDRNDSITWSRRNRTIKSHMELNTCMDAVKANSESTLRNVVLLHMSDANSDEERFRTSVQMITRAKVSVARKGFEIELNKNPF